MLKIDIEYKKGILFLRLIGKLNKESINRLNEILDIVNNVGFKYVMFNFEKVYSIDQEGINIISNISRTLKDNNALILTCGYNDLIKLKIENSNIKNYVLETNNELGALKLINI